MTHLVADRHDEPHSHGLLSPLGAAALTAT